MTQKTRSGINIDKGRSRLGILGCCVRSPFPLCVLACSEESSADFVGNDFHVRAAFYPAETRHITCSSDSTSESLGWEICVEVKITCTKHVMMCVHSLPLPLSKVTMLELSQYIYRAVKTCTRSRLHDFVVTNVIHHAYIYRTCVVGTRQPCLVPKSGYRCRLPSEPS